MRKVPVLAFLLVTIATLTMSSSACLFQKQTEPSTRCNDSAALNYNKPEACTFSRVIFYSGVSAVFPITVTVDGTQVGTITGFWPTGPGNCSADFTAKANFSDGKAHDWNVRTANGIANSGTTRANPSQECVVVRVF